jgi:hypothetical protein
LETGDALHADQSQRLYPAIAPANRLLDPVDRISEILFGLIMVLTSTGTLSVLSAGRADVKTMIIGALGCNLAWGIIDAGIHLMGVLDERGRNFNMLRAAQHDDDADSARTLIDRELPDPVAAVITPPDLEALRQRLRQLPAPAPAALTMNDALGAFAICLWVFLSTFPVVIPFLFVDELHSALRISNAIAIAMLFLCGYAFAMCIGRRPWATGLLMVTVGCVLVGIAIALGG